MQHVHDHFQHEAPDFDRIITVLIPEYARMVTALIDALPFDRGADIRVVDRDASGA